jgi:hypothetical protein
MQDSAAARRAREVTARSHGVNCTWNTCADRDVLLQTSENADETYGKTCVTVRMIHYFFLFKLGLFMIQNLQRTHVETLFSGTDYTFAVLHLYEHRTL